MCLRLLSIISLARAAGGVTEEAPSCVPARLVQKTGFRNLTVSVKDRFATRWFLLYVPEYYKLTAPVPLWILAPGAWNEPGLQIRMAELVSYAEEQQFAFIALKGVGNLMNVFLQGLPRTGPDYADDVVYTQAALDEVRRQLCIDPRRVFCAGYSRGARFCSRLASELSPVLAAIAPVSGLRFPEPSNATRPMPIITFHGTGDPVNPYAGGADPRANHEYWDDPVEVAVSKWVRFNGCTREESYRQSKHVVIHKHTKCKNNADVVFVKIDKGGHTWPGSRFHWSKGLGVVNREINASVMMGAFFKEHPLPAPGAEGTARIHMDMGAFHSVSAMGLASMGLATGMLTAALVPRILRCLCSRSDPDSDSEGWSS
uniref:Feruloyl esterase n=1 Tax=Alexandrium monilatum TaxID=311494 RepID=A0A7S4SI63_9DINO|mmetsp:Transcript_568/g.1989  ORF Transcript_568/g.1989 Transcript_568/m.1989 type:complete len:372 (-) Transcript_568:54-1169(-)